MVRLVLFMMVALLFISACGEKEPIIPDPPPLSEQIVGVWEIVMIEGKEPALYYTEDLGEVGVEVSVPKKEFVFADNGSIFVKLEWIVVVTEGAISETFPGSLALKGTYTVTDSTLTTVLEDVKLTVDPEDEWVYDDTTELGFEIGHSKAELVGDTLTLTEDDGAVIVLERRT